jgi:hypothetical protein
MQAATESLMSSRQRRGLWAGIEQEKRRRFNRNETATSSVAASCALDPGVGDQSIGGQTILPPLKVIENVPLKKVGPPSGVGVAAAIALWPALTPTGPPTGVGGFLWGGFLWGGFPTLTGGSVTGGALTGGNLPGGTGDGGIVTGGTGVGGSVVGGGVVGGMVPPPLPEPPPPVTGTGGPTG